MFNSLDIKSLGTFDYNFFGMFLFFVNLLFLAFFINVAYVN